MSESVGRANLPTGQSLPISRENRERRRPPGGKKRPRPDEPTDTAETDPPAEPGEAVADIDDSGHVDVLM